MFIIAGSMIRPATCSPIFSSTLARASASLKGTARVSSVHRVGDAAAVGDADRVVAGAERLQRRVDRDHHGVVVAVVGALDLEDHVAAGGAASEVDGVHRRLGAGVGEAPLRQAEAALQLGGDGDRAVGRGGEVGAFVDPRLDRGADRRGWRGRCTSPRSRCGSRRIRCRRRPRRGCPGRARGRPARGRCPGRRRGRRSASPRPRVRRSRPRRRCGCGTAPAGPRSAPRSACGRSPPRVQTSPAAAPPA